MWLLGANHLNPTPAGKPGREGKMKKGDIVKFSEILDSGDEDIRMVLLEDPDGGRVLVQELCDMYIQPQRVLGLEHLTPGTYNGVSRMEVVEI
jgi:hypothetical protein